MRPLDLGHKDHLDIRYGGIYQEMEESLRSERKHHRWSAIIFIALVAGAYHWFSMNSAILVCLVGIFIVLYDSLLHLTVSSISAQMIDLRLQELNWRIKELEEASDESWMELRDAPGKREP
jgi:hypothetical protein